MGEYRIGDRIELDIVDKKVDKNGNRFYKLRGYQQDITEKTINIMMKLTNEMHMTQCKDCINNIERNTNNEICERCTLKIRPELVNNFKSKYSNTDWSKVKIDTKVLVRDTNIDYWRRGYFAKYDGEKFYIFDNGANSFTSNRCKQYKQCILYDEQEPEVINQITKEN